MTLDKLLGQARHITAAVLLGIGVVYFIALAIAAFIVLLPLALLARIFDPHILRLDTKEVTNDK